MSDRSSTRRHYAFVIRLWQDSVQAPWRVILQPADTGERLAFANLEELLFYLHRVCESDGGEILPSEGA
jgi:hypothetical protein